MNPGELPDVTPPEGVETDWIPLGGLDLADGRLALADPMFLYQAEAIRLPAGPYLVSVRLRGYRGHRIVAKLRVASEPGGAPGESVASIVVDSAQVGVGDLAVVAPAIERLDGDAYDERLAESAIDGPVGIFRWDEESPMYLAGTGLGDGRYSVREVVSGSRRIGVEVDFLEEWDA